MKSLINDLFYFPSWGIGTWLVWRRNFLDFRYTLGAALSWIFVDPILMLSALGFGLGQFVQQINGQSYAQFIAPALLCTTGMFVSFFEGTYGVYTKLSRQNTYQSIILTPIGSDEIALAEIAWAASKAMASVLAVGIVTSTLHLTQPLYLGLPLLYLAIFCWGMAAFSVWLATISPSYDWFVYFQSGLVMPMSLFCGTYFPIEQLPSQLLFVVYLLPLTHVLIPSRIFLNGGFEPIVLLSLGYLILFGVLFTNLASARLRRHLIF